MRTDFCIEKPRNRVGEARILRRMGNTALLSLGTAFYEAASGNQVGVGIALGAGVIATAAVGALTYMREVGLEQRQNNTLGESSTQ